MLIIKLISFSDIIAHGTDKTTAPIMSVGKCTYKYILENAISTARAVAAIPVFLLIPYAIHAAENDVIVCPDGNEYLYYGGNIIILFIYIIAS